MRIQARAILPALAAALVLGTVALFLGGLLVALAVGIPVAILATLLFGSRVEGSRHDPR